MSDKSEKEIHQWLSELECHTADIEFFEWGAHKWDTLLASHVQSNLVMFAKRGSGGIFAIWKLEDGRGLWFIFAIWKLEDGRGLWFIFAMKG